MPGPYEIHLFVCTNDFACIKDGPAKDIQKHLKRRAKDEGLYDRLRVNQAGCFNQCGHGPMLAVYPDNVWYSHLELPDADRIWDEHIKGGRPVADLLYQPPRPGKNKLPRTGDASRQLDVVDRASTEYRPCPRCPPRGESASIKPK
jgi:(2Fe-2S) ferredoxin